VVSKSTPKGYLTMLPKEFKTFQYIFKIITKLTPKGYLRMLPKEFLKDFCNNWEVSKPFLNCYSPAVALLAGFWIGTLVSYKGCPVLLGSCTHHSFSIMYL
jgi:hypothetical protein